MLQSVPITHSISTIITSTSLQSFKTMFISIILDALPYILLGVLFSAILQVFVSERTIQRLTPGNPFLGILFACLLGILFPMCECGMIPVVRRLLLKGMQLHVAIVFIIVGPIINPIAFAATYMAFPGRPEIAYYRVGLAFCIAVVIGMIIYWTIRKNPLKNSSHTLYASDLLPPSDHNHKGNKITATLSHATDEFFEMGKFLIFGSAATALIQTFVARESLMSLGQGPVSSHVFMMGFSYILSLCSTSDAFVASSFTTTFSAGSLLTFLVFGPMLDLKSTIMLLNVFKTKFVLILIGLIVVTVFTVSILFDQLYLH